MGSLSTTNIRRDCLLYFFLGRRSSVGLDDCAYGNTTVHTLHPATKMHQPVCYASSQGIPLYLAFKSFVRGRSCRYLMCIKYPNSRLREGKEVKHKSYCWYK